MQLPYFARTLLFMTAGPLVWAVHLAFIYVMTALVCARPVATSAWRNEDMLLWALGLAAIIAIAIILWITLRGFRSGGSRENIRFVEWTALALAALAIYAIVLETLPILLVPACP